MKPYKPREMEDQMEREKHLPGPAGHLIYNVTVKVNAAIAKAWLAWLLEEHIPQVLATGCFTTYQLVRLLEVDDSEGPTYAIQYRAASRADYDRYMEGHATELRSRSYAKWGDRFMAFHSVMEVVQ